MALKKSILSALAALLLLTSAQGGQAQAEELTGTLKKIKETGVITLGHPETSVPFAYLDGNQKPIGTGPYKVKEFKPNDIITYEINDQYRDATKPFFKTVQIKKNEKGILLRNGSF